MNAQKFEEALILCDNMLTQLIDEGCSNKIMVMLSNIKSKIIYGLDEEEKPQYKFKKGDRVKCIKENEYVEVGAKGVINENSFYPFVIWDEFGKDEYNDSTMWALAEQDMELI